MIDCCTPLAGSSLEDQQAAELEAVIKALADRHRLRIVNMLLRADGEAVCVCEFQPLLDLSQGTVSHHLKILVEAGLVDREDPRDPELLQPRPRALDSVREVFTPAAACC